MFVPFFSPSEKLFQSPCCAFFLCVLVCFLRQCCSSLLPQILGKKPPHLLKCFLEIYTKVKTASFVCCIHFVFSSPTPTAFFIIMFSFYRNEIRHHVRLDKKEDFAVPGIKYTAMSSKWVLIVNNKSKCLAILLESWNNFIFWLFFFIGLKNSTFPSIKRSWINSFNFSFPKISTWHISLQTFLLIFSPPDNFIW